MRPLTRRRIGVTTIIVGLAGAGIGLSAGPVGAVEGPEVEPILVEETANIPCSTLDDTFGGGQTWLEVKFADEELEDGTIEGVTIDLHDDNTFDWSSTFGIDAVYVKSGQGGSNLYLYAPNADAAEATADDGLTSPQQISHISFCYDTTNPTTTTTVEETTTTVEETTTTTAAPTTTTTVQVLGTSVVPATTTTLATQVAGVQLARTGSNNGSLVALSVGLVFVGLGLVLLGDGGRLLAARRD